MEYTLFYAAALLVEFMHIGAGLALVLIGKSLVSLGVQTRIRGEAETRFGRINLITTSPGVVFMVAGAVLIGFAVVTQATYTLPGGSHPPNQAFLTPMPPDADTGDRAPGARTAAPTAPVSETVAREFFQTTGAILRRADTGPAGPLLARLDNLKNADETDIIALIQQIVEDAPSAMEVIACSDDFDWIVRNPVLYAAARQATMTRIGQGRMGQEAPDSAQER